MPAFIDIFVLLYMYRETAMSTDVTEVTSEAIDNDLGNEDKQRLEEEGITALSYSSSETEWQGNRLFLEKLVARLE